MGYTQEISADIVNYICRNMHINKWGKREVSLLSTEVCSDLSYFISECLNWPKLNIPPFRLGYAQIKRDCYTSSHFKILFR